MSLFRDDLKGIWGGGVVAQRHAMNILIQQKTKIFERKLHFMDTNSNNSSSLGWLACEYFKFSGYKYLI